MERFSQPVRNGIHGHKTSLLTRLRKSHVPRWMYPSYPLERNNSRIRIESSEPRSEFLERWQDMAEHFQFRQTVGYRIYPNRGKFDRGDFKIFDTQPNIVPPPEPIKTRCEEYLTSPRHQSEMRTIGSIGEFEGFHINVIIGPKSGIQAITLTADYLR